jgi:hypothetical protein
LGAFDHPGHAAMAIMHRINQDIVGYVSLWPKFPTSNPLIKNPGMTSKPDKDFYYEMGEETRNRLTRGMIEPRPGQLKGFDAFQAEYQIKIKPNDEFLNEWVQQPTDVISIPTVSFDRDYTVTGTTVGLNSKNILDWWEVYKKDRENLAYRFVSKKYNCASVVMYALLAGGSKGFLDPGKAWFYYTPNDILAYASRLRTAIERVQKDVKTIDDAILSNIRYVPPTRSCGFQELYSPEEFKRASYVKIGRRHGAIVQIDRDLKSYWRLGPWTHTNRADKKQKLIRLIGSIQMHIIEKPRSDRREAVLTLGSQCTKVLKWAESDSHFQEYLL